MEGAQSHSQEVRACLGSVGRQGGLLASREGGQCGHQETHSGCRLEEAATATYPRDKVLGHGDGKNWAVSGMCGLPGQQDSQGSAGRRHVSVCTGRHNKKKTKTRWAAELTDVYSLTVWRLKVQDQGVGRVGVS